MSRIPRTVLREPRRTRLLTRLEALYAATDAAARRAVDPVGLVHRYRDPRDAEIAGLVAALLAYGRVDLFRPVVQRILATAEARGGPRAFVEIFDPDRDGADLRPLVYRWNRGVDFVLLFSALRRVIALHGGLEPLFAGWRSADVDVYRVLAGAIATLRASALAVAPACGLKVDDFSALPRGFRYLLPSPADGSACKRWNMYLRWMVRPATEGIDLGLWRSIPPRALVMPMDTHTTRIAGFVGLTRRPEGSWRTAVEVTRNLRRLDPDDPVRFDFAIAHLGISGACKGRRDEGVCPACPLEPVCVAGGHDG